MHVDICMWAVHEHANTHGYCDDNLDCQLDSVPVFISLPTTRIEYLDKSNWREMSVLQLKVESVMVGSEQQEKLEAAEHISLE